MAAKKKTPPREHVLAREIRLGAWEPAHLELVTLSDGGSAAAAAVVTQTFGALGAWSSVLQHAPRFLADPGVARAGNVFTDVTRLVRRAMKETGDDSRLAELSALVPKKWHGLRDATLLRDVVLPSERAGEEQRAAYDDAVKLAAGAANLVNRPLDLARHCFSLAAMYRVQDEVLRRWSEENGWGWWGGALDVVRVHLRRGEPQVAWAELSPWLPRWLAVDALQVFPIELLVDPTVRVLLTPERAREVLALRREPPE